MNNPRIGSNTGITALPNNTPKIDRARTLPTQTVDAPTPNPEAFQRTPDEFSAPTETVSESTFEQTPPDVSLLETPPEGDAMPESLELASVLNESEGLPATEVANLLEAPTETAEGEQPASAYKDIAETLGMSADEVKSFRDNLAVKIARTGMTSGPAARILQTIDKMAANEGSFAGASGKLRGVLLVATQAKLMQSNQPEIAKQIGVPKLNAMVDGMVAHVSKGSVGATNIINSYLGRDSGKAEGSARDIAANADQRINDLADLVGMMSGEQPMDEVNAGRIVFEMVLDHGADAALAMKEMMPPNARAKYEQTVKKVEAKMAQLTTRLGKEGFEEITKLAKDSPEIARYLGRLITDDSVVGKAAHTIDLLGEIAKSPAGKKILGETGSKALTALHGLLQLDNFSQNQLKALLSADTAPALRAEALHHLVDNFKAKFAQLNPGNLEAIKGFSDQIMGKVKTAFNVSTEVMADVGRRVAAGAAGVVEDAAEILSKKVDDLAKAMGMSPATTAKFKSMVSKMGPEAAENALHLVKRAGKELASTFVSMVSGMPPSAVETIFSSRVVGEMVVDTVKAAGKALSKMGISIAEQGPKLAAKLGKGVMKVIPALGGVMSAYDTGRMAKMAMDSNLKPEVRTLALLGSAINGADTVLAVTEALGVGNVAFPAQLALAGASLVIDVAIDHYKENPMPEKMVKTIRRGAALAALGGVVAAPLTGGGTIGVSAALAGIWGGDVLAKELVSMGKEGIAELKKLVQAGGELADKAWQGLKDMGAKGVDVLKGWATEGGRMATQAYDKMAQMGQQGMAAIKDLAHKGGQVATDALNAMKRAGTAGINALKDLVKAGDALAGKAISSLKSMGSAGVAAVKSAMNDLWNAGASGMKSLASLYRNSGISEVTSFMMDKLKTAWNDSSFSNGYEGIRDLIGEMWDSASAAGSEAKAFVKDMVSQFDQKYAGDWVPDWTYDWM